MGAAREDDLAGVMVGGLISRYRAGMSYPALKVQIDPALVAEAERLGVDLSAASQTGVERAVVLKRNAAKTDAELAADAQAWAAENAEAIEAHRKRIDRDGVFGEDFRTW